MELRRQKTEVYWNSSTDLGISPPTHPQQDKAPVLNLGIKLTFQFMVFQALDYTEKGLVSKLMLKNKQTNPLEYLWSLIII